jgi:MoxR-like ATPase
MKDRMSQNQSLPADPADWSDVDQVIDGLAGQAYQSDRALATVAFLAGRLGRPLLLEGEPGVGKTEIAKALAAATGRNLIRLQCYEGLDQSAALYDWAYAKQMLAIRLAEAAGKDMEQVAAGLYGPDYLIKRPLLQALELDEKGLPAVLLIDELDRADVAFEAFLLELLSDYQVSIPEMGSIRAAKPPLVIVTSNRTREIHDALKRRCLYHWLDYPSPELERQIIAARLPGIGEQLSAELVGFVHKLREQTLFKPPGVAETLDWAQALIQLDALALEPGQLEATLGVLLKYQDDIAAIQGSEAQRLLDEVKADLAHAGNRWAER